MTPNRSTASGSSLLHAAFLRTVRKEPHRRLLCGRPGGPWLTAGQIARRVEALAARLGEHGLTRGRVALLPVGNRPAFLIADLAVWKRGAVLLPVEESLPAAGLAQLAKRFSASVIVRGPARLRGLPAVLALAPRGTRSARLHPPDLPRGACLVRLTSGTAGEPQAVVCTARQLVADGRAILRAMGIRRDDLTIGAIPAGHAYGFGNLVLPLILQGSPLLLLGRPLPALLARVFRMRRPTVFPAVPYLLDLLARQPGARAGGLRLCISAGAPLPRSVAKAFFARFGIPVRNFFGASETGGIAFDGSPMGDAPEGCVGRLLPGVRVSMEPTRIGGLPRGQGRIIVRGPAVAAGYAPRPSPDLGLGRFRSQDLGWLDEKGRLHLRGRLSERANVSGRKVHPAEVERCLLEIPGVTEAVVLALPDALRGHRLEAWVAADGSLDSDLRLGMARRLPAHKLPRLIHFVRALPRTERGKIDRRRLAGLSQ